MKFGTVMHLGPTTTASAAAASASAAAAGAAAATATDYYSLVMHLGSPDPNSQ